MKKITALFLSFILCLSVCSCKQRSENFEVPAAFYYLQSQDSLDLSQGAICSEMREIKPYESQLDALLNVYFTGPVTDACTSPFPAGLQVVSVLQEGNKVELTLNDVFADLQGLDLTVSLTCISMTLFELTQCDSVEIQTESKLINGKDSVSVSRDMLYLTDLTHNAAK